MATNRRSDSIWPPLVEMAFREASIAHDGQFRKASRLPYFYHPAAVALILARAGFEEEETIAAAVLHDVIEDTPRSWDDLAERFPLRVLELIGELSEQKRDAAGESLPWVTRKAEHLKRLRDASVEGKAIALADQLHNLSTMLADQEVSADFWDRFNAPRTEILDAHCKRVEACGVDDERIALLCREVTAVLDQLEADAA
ncbi:Bifunctional (p)ppGpp synthase/hydrolase SpoT [Stratiformator vulcanicus]|uniref:Bifunctional (P)ppGpp synthase/hydrolase SpoT n=1 Tax=Stratiformator vulcanicus TaxID=2527980 RepID=A0A517R695_9PLAN|nr:Bifunctional (p)ppGpp synthase/hydrolase SpoT [Stratiformator vulcanicus]